MFGLVTKLLMHKQLEFEAGAISLLKQNVAFMPFHTLFEVQKLIEKSRNEYELYKSSKELGKIWIENLFKDYKMKTIKEQAQWGENVFSLAGHGKMKVVKWDVNTKHMVYRVEDSVMSKFYGKVGRCVDHIPRGWFAGAGSVFFKEDVDAVEIKCKAKGDPYCEFDIRPLKDFDKKNKLVKEQLKL